MSTNSNILILQSWGGGLAFLHMNPAAMEEMISDENPASLLAYVNSDHEYILFDPYGAQACERGVGRRHSLGGFQETGRISTSFIISIFMYYNYTNLLFVGFQHAIELLQTGNLGGSSDSASC